MPAASRTFGSRQLLATLVVLLLAALAQPATGQAAAMSCLVPAADGARAPTPPLRFGIYPGGPAGSVNPKLPPVAEDPARRLAALRSLAGGMPFVVRLYSAWTGSAAADDPAAWLDREVTGYTAAGLRVELVVRYKPLVADAAAPAAFADHVRSLVRRYGPDRRFVSLQVTNEANLPDAPDAADGAFAGALRALADGVVAAKRQVRRDDLRQLRIGFSWAYDERPEASTAFWSELGRVGGRALADATDWVGLDTYPATWAPQLALGDTRPASIARAVRESVRWLRDCLMPRAGLGRDVALQIAENGFPTGPGRSERLQSLALGATVRGVHALRRRYNITDYRWFSLRDSNSRDPQIESQYGILRDDYSPKLGFETYRAVVQRYGDAPGGLRASAASCRRSPVRLAVPRVRRKRPTSMTVRVGGRIVGRRIVRRTRRARIPRSVRVSLLSGRRSVTVSVARTVGGRRHTRKLRRSLRVC